MTPAARRRLVRVLIVVATLVVSVVGAAAYPLAAKGTDWFTARWQIPWFFLALLVVPYVFYRGTWGQDSRAPRLKLGTVAALSTGPSGTRVLLRDVPGVLRAVALVCIALALARPVSSVTPDTTEDEGIDVVIVLDLSASMEAVIDNLPSDLREYVGEKQRGLRPTRLDAAKAVIRDFISRRKTDRIGIVVFSSTAYVLSPPTLDYHLLDSLVTKMELGLVPGSGTAIGDGLGTAVARLRKSTAASKAVLLVTDGDSNAGQVAPEYAAHLATVVGAKVYTVQIGAGDQAEVFTGRTDLFGQPQYATMSFPTNPELLRKIATQTGGRMYLATDAKALQASFHDVLNELEKSKFESTVASFEDLYRFLLLPGVVLVAIEALLRSLVLRRFP